VTNTLDYYDTKLITAMKGLQHRPLGSMDITFGCQTLNYRGSYQKYCSLSFVNL